MRILDPGHVYALQHLDIKDGSFAEAILCFVKRIGPNYPGNNDSHAGTTMQEVLRALIDRIQYLDNQIPDPRNKIVLDNLRDSIYLLESRAAERHGRTLIVSIDNIETYPTCPKCLHIGCKGECHDI